jgi:hypothetical protein
MLTTGRSTEANGNRRRWMFRRPGQKSAPGGDGMSNPQGGRSMHASEILFVGSGFRLFFNLTEAKAAFHRAEHSVPSDGVSIAHAPILNARQPLLTNS